MEIRNFIQNNSWNDCDDSNKAQWLRAASTGNVLRAFITHEGNTDFCEMTFVKELAECTYKANKVIAITGLNAFLIEFNN